MLCRRCDCAPISPACRWRTRRCTVSVATRCLRRSSEPGFRRRPSLPSSSSRIRSSRPWRSPTRRSPARWTCCCPAPRASSAAIAHRQRSRRRPVGRGDPAPDGGWRRLLGDEIGWLLADHILRHTTGDDRLVITTLVSSSLLSKMAAELRRPLRRDVHRVQVDRPHRPRANPESHFVFGYEQALGYLVCGRPLDKDGITRRRAAGRGRRARREPRA